MAYCIKHVIYYPKSKHSKNPRKLRIKYKNWKEIQTSWIIEMQYESLQNKLRSALQQHYVVSQRLWLMHFSICGPKLA